MKVQKIILLRPFLINNYSPIITEPEANNCFSINTQVINSKKEKEKALYNAKNFISSQARERLAAILFVEVIIG